MLRNMKIKMCIEGSWNNAVVQNISFVGFDVLIAVRGGCVLGCPLKFQPLSTRLHGATSQKTAIFSIFL
jgi:hypothetical protein